MCATITYALLLPKLLFCKGYDGAHLLTKVEQHPLFWVLTRAATVLAMLIAMIGISSVLLSASGHLTPYPDINDSCAQQLLVPKNSAEVI